MTLGTDRRVPLEGTYNFRDTGGIPLTSGGSIRPGILFRSDALSGLTPSGLEEFAATPVGVVVDLRTPQEREISPNRIPTTRSMQSVDLSILAGSMAQMASSLLGNDGSPSEAAIARLDEELPALADLYTAILQSGASAFAEVARYIARSTDDSETAVLVHCTAGKDRTGVATALMLEAAGAERDAIVADYASSQQYLAGEWADSMLRMISSAGLPITPKLRALITETSPDAIDRALTWVDEGFGGVTGYLASGGLTDAELAGLRTRLAG